MKWKRLILFCCCGLMTSLSPAATFIIEDASSEVGNPAGLTAGDTINFTGIIISTSGDGFDLTPVLSNITLNVLAGATVSSITGTSEGIDINSTFDGTLSVWGTVSGAGAGEGIDVDGSLTGNFNIFSGATVTGGDDGIDILGDLIGSIINAGAISGGDGGIEINDDLLESGNITNSGTIFGGVDGIFVNDDLRGSVTNTGSITSNGDGISIENDLEGTITNSGTIAGRTESGIYVFDELIPSAGIFNSGTITGGDEGIDVDDLFGTIVNSGIIEGGDRGIFAFTGTTGTIRNEGGRIQGGTAAMRLGAGNATVVLSGPSHIIGTMNGGAGTNDVLRFENMRGINAARKAELAALAAADVDGTITLFGESIAWINFEDIQFDANSILAYSDLITDPTFSTFTNALDNVTGLNDDFRDFLKALNNIDLLLLEDALRSSTGLSFWNALQDLQQNLDVSLFNQMMHQLGSVPFSSSSFSFASLDSLDSTSMRQLKQNLIALDAQGTPDLPPLEQATIQPINANDLVSSAYLAGYAETGHQSATGDRSKSSSIRGSVLLGSGSWLTENLYLGGFAGYTKSDARIDIFNSSLTTHSAQAGMSASYRWNDWFANVIAGLGYHGIYTTRWNVANQQFNGETDGYQGMVMSQLGYHWVNSAGTARLTPYVGISYSTLHTNGYTETSGTPGAALRFDDGAMDSLQTTIGFNATRHYETFFGFIRPQMGASWWHALEESNTFAMSLATPGLLNSFTVESSNTNRDRAVYSLGVTVGLDELTGWAFHFAYQGSTGSEGYQSHGGTAGALYEF